MKSQWFLLALGVLIMVTTLSVAIYILFFYEPVPVEDLAQQLCACAQSAEVQNSELAQAKEPFKYRSELEGCFGEFFKSYEDESFSPRDKELFIDQVTEKVMELCPQSLDMVFKK